MPRFGSNRRSGSSSPPPRNTTTANRPTYAPPQQAPTTTQAPGMFSGFGSTMVQGMAFGAGSEVAHQAVRGMMGTGSHNQQAQNQPQQQQQNYQSQQPVCMNEANMFTNCLKQNSDISYCQNFADMLKQCQQSYQH